MMSTYLKKDKKYAGPAQEELLAKIRLARSQALAFAQQQKPENPLNSIIFPPLLEELFSVDNKKNLPFRVPGFGGKRDVFFFESKIFDEPLSRTGWQDLYCEIVNDLMDRLEKIVLENKPESLINYSNAFDLQCDNLKILALFDIERPQTFDRQAKADKAIEDSQTVRIFREGLAAINQVISISLQRSFEEAEMVDTVLVSDKFIKICAKRADGDQYVLHLGDISHPVRRLLIYLLEEYIKTATNDEVSYASKNLLQLVENANPFYVHDLNQALSNFPAGAFKEVQKICQLFVQAHEMDVPLEGRALAQYKNSLSEDELLRYIDFYLDKASNGRPSFLRLILEGFAFAQDQHGAFQEAVDSGNSEWLVAQEMDLRQKIHHMVLNNFRAVMALLGEQETLSVSDIEGWKGIDWDDPIAMVMSSSPLAFNYMNDRRKLAVVEVITGKVPDGFDRLENRGFFAVPAERNALPVPGM